MPFFSAAMRDFKPDMLLSLPAVQLSQAPQLHAHQHRKEEGSKESLCCNAGWKGAKNVDWDGLNCDAQVYIKNKDDLQQHKHH